MNRPRVPSYREESGCRSYFKQIQREHNRISFRSFFYSNFQGRKERITQDFATEIEAKDFLDRCFKEMAEGRDPQTSKRKIDHKGLAKKGQIARKSKCDRMQFFFTDRTAVRKSGAIYNRVEAVVRNLNGKWKAKTFKTKDEAEDWVIICISAMKKLKQAKEKILTEQEDDLSSYDQTLQFFNQAKAIECDHRRGVQRS